MAYVNLRECFQNFKNYISRTKEKAQPRTNCKYDCEKFYTSEVDESFELEFVNMHTIYGKKYNK